MQKLHRIEIKAGLNVISPIILFLLLLLLDIRFHLTIKFYFGLSLFTTIYIITYIWDVRYFLLIRKIVFSAPILVVKKEIAKLEKYKTKTTRMRYAFMPFAILGIFLMFAQKPIFNTESIVMLALIIIVFILSPLQSLVNIFIEIASNSYVDKTS